MRRYLCLLQLILLLLLGGCASQFGEATPPPPRESDPAQAPEPEAEAISATTTPLTEAQVLNFYVELGRDLLYLQQSEDGQAYLTAYAQDSATLVYELLEAGYRRTPLTTLAEQPRALIFTTAEQLQIIAAREAPTYSALRSFPSRLSFYRLQDGSYHQETHAYLAPLEQDYSFGTETPAQLQSLRFSHNGLELQFQSAQLPRVECSFDAANGGGLLTLYDTGSSLSAAALQNSDATGAVQRLSLTERQGNLYLQLWLNPAARYYSLQRSHTLEESAVLELQLFTRAGE